MPSRHKDPHPSKSIDGLCFASGEVKDGIESVSSLEQGVVAADAPRSANCGNGADDPRDIKSLTELQRRLRCHP